MSDALVRAAFESRLKTWADAQVPPLRIAFQNVTFTTPPVGLYLRAFVLPASTVSNWLERTDRERKGIYQVSIVLPIGGGSVDGSTVSAALDALFPLNVPMVQGAIKVSLLTPFSPGNAMQEPDRYVIPVTARYQASAV